MTSLLKLATHNRGRGTNWAWLSGRGLMSIGWQEFYIVRSATAAGRAADDGSIRYMSKCIEDRGNPSGYFANKK